MEKGATAADEETGDRLATRGSGPLPSLVEVSNLRKQYGRLVLFEDINFCVRRQEMLAIVGQSGAGKSTLLHILGSS